MPDLEGQAERSSRYLIESPRACSIVRKCVHDEPTVGLDPVARHGVWDLVRNLREQVGATVLITTHLMDEAEALCDRIGVLDAGVLEAVGTRPS